MSGKRESFTLDALLKNKGDTNETDHLYQEVAGNAITNASTETEKPESKQQTLNSNSTVKEVLDFATAIESIKALKLEHKTKMDIGSETNKKVMMISKVLGVNGYALVDFAVNEFLARNKKDIEKAMRQMLK